MEEEKRFCIICPNELIARELTCSKECAKQYSRISKRVVSKLNSKPNKCIICQNELPLEDGSICQSGNCKKIFNSIKEHLVKRCNNVEGKRD